MPSPFDDVCCARISREALALLASLRVEPGLHAAILEPYVWLGWEAGNERVLRTVLPIHGVVLFRFHEGHWHRFGEHLPAFDFPGGLEYQPLAHVLFPAPVQPIAAPPLRAQPFALTLQRDDVPRPTTAWLGPFAPLLAWCDGVPTARLQELEGAWHEGNVLVLGANLPLLNDGVRLWGRDVLMPQGFAPAIALPESALREAAGAADDELLLWQTDRAEMIARSALAPLTRAGLRLAARRERS